MANNDFNHQNGSGDDIATSGELQETQGVDIVNDSNNAPQQADSLIDLTPPGSQGHPVALSSSPHASQEPALSPGIAVATEQVDNSDERSELPRAPVAEMMPLNRPDSPLFCSQEPETREGSVTDEPSDHHAAASSCGPGYSYAITQTTPEARAPGVSNVAQGTTAAIGERFYCPLCEASYSRKSRVRDHFDICQYKHGNPDGLGWNAHESCWPQRTARDPADLKCPLCGSEFSRASEAKAHFVTCADKKGNPENIVFQGMSTATDTLYGEEDGEVGKFRCALCGKVSGKRSHARTHWKVCAVKLETSAGKLRRYDDMGRIMHRPEEGEDSAEGPADDGEKVAKTPRQRGSTKYKCDLCGRKHREFARAKDHFQRCLRKHGKTREEVGHLDDTGKQIRPALRDDVPMSPPRRKRRRVASEDDTSEEESDPEQDYIIGPGKPRTGRRTMFQIRQQLQPKGAEHLYRRHPDLESAKKRAAEYFIREVTGGWSPEDQAGQRMTEFAAEVRDILPGLKAGETFWAKERDCKIDGKGGTFLVWVEEVEVPDIL